jgi:hypothetical protein
MADRGSENEMSPHDRVEEDTSRVQDRNDRNIRDDTLGLVSQTPRGTVAP